MYRLAVAFAAGAALAAPSVAQELPRIAVVARAGADPPVSASALAAALGARVGESAQILVDPRFTVEAVLRERLAPFARARQLSDEGWRAYHEVEPGFAESRLVQARRVALEVADLQGGPELLAEISLRLGAVRLYRGRSDEARADLRLAVTLAPDRAVTRSEFRPAVVELYDEARGAPAESGRLAVAAPEAAQLEVDGARVDDPGGELALAVGHHLIVVRSRGHRPEARIVDVSLDVQRIEVALERDELAAALAEPLEIGLAEQDAALRVEAATLHGELVAFVLLAPVWRRGAPALIGQRCEAVPTRCTEVVEVGFTAPADLPAAVDRLWASLTERRGARRFPPTLLVDARLTRGEPRPAPGGGPMPDDEPRAWWKSGWLWAGVGTAAVATSAWLLLSQDVTVDTVITLDPCRFGGACAD